MSPEKTLFYRILLVVLLIGLVFLAMWWHRDGLQDNIDKHISFTDVIYFTMITVTTVGYGDIVPVSDAARLTDALFVTPIRIFIWFIFFGTAYQFVFQKFLEGYRMAKLQSRLTDHIIICGYGHTGRCAAQELAAKGHASDSIVVIDPKEPALQAAVEDGFIALRGDATQERMLKKAGIDKAQAVIVVPGRDDANILIVLTIRQLNPAVKIIASVRELENLKIVKQGGADVIVSPSKAGGYLLANAISHPNTVEYLYDLMTAGGSVTLVERPVRADEVGQSKRMVDDGMVVGLLRGHEKIGFWEVEKTPLRAGDTLLLISRIGEHQPAR